MVRPSNHEPMGIHFHLSVAPRRSMITRNDTGESRKILTRAFGQLTGITAGAIMNPNALARCTESKRTDFRREEEGLSAQTLVGTPREVREQIRSGQWRGVTSGVAPGYVQANLAVLPQELAFDFLLFCQRNPKPCPLLEVVEAGRTSPDLTSTGADIRTDLPGYRVYRNGEFTDEVESLEAWWRDDLVSFLLGCSFSFEAALTDAGLPLRHQEMDCNVPMYITNIPTTPAGVFSGPMVVSMRPIPQLQIVRAVQVTSRFPATHGAPVHIGDPAAIGIKHLDRPDFGDAVEVRAGEEPLFWACGVTPQAVAMNCKPSLMLTHAPGRMFITDQRDADYAVL